MKLRWPHNAKPSQTAATVRSARLYLEHGWIMAHEGQAFLLTTNSYVASWAMIEVDELPDDPVPIPRRAMMEMERGSSARHEWDAEVDDETGAVTVNSLDGPITFHRVPNLNPSSHPPGLPKLLPHETTETIDIGLSAKFLTGVAAAVGSGDLGLRIPVVGDKPIAVRPLSTSPQTREAILAPIRLDPNPWHE